MNTLIEYSTIIYAPFMESKYIKSERDKTNAMPANTLADNAVGVQKSEHQQRHWYIAIVGNKTEKACYERLSNWIKQQPNGATDYEIYLPTQKTLRLKRNGQRTYTDCILFPTLLFIKCSEKARLKEVVRLPYIKRFFVNIAGANDKGHRPVAIIPDQQIEDLKRLASDADSPISIESHVYQIGERVRVIAGNLTGLEGYVCREADNSTCLVIKMDVLGCAKVSISQELLQPII